MKGNLHDCQEGTNMFPLLMVISPISVVGDTERRSSEVPQNGFQGRAKNNDESGSLEDEEKDHDEQRTVTGDMVVPNSKNYIAI